VRQTRFTGGDDFTQPGELCRKCCRTDRRAPGHDHRGSRSDGVAPDTQKEGGRVLAPGRPDLGARVSKGLGNGG